MLRVGKLVRESCLLRGVIGVEMLRGKASWGWVIWRKGFQTPYPAFQSATRSGAVSGEPKCDWMEANAEVMASEVYAGIGNEATYIMMKV